MSGWSKAEHFALARCRPGRDSLTWRLPGCGPIAEEAFGRVQRNMRAASNDWAQIVRLV
jgi:hypothetical protein